MQSSYQYIFDRSSKKFHCPICGKQKFVYYIDSVTGEYLPAQYGKCERIESCGYYLNPYKDGYHKRNSSIDFYRSNDYSRSKNHKDTILIHFDLESYKATLEVAYYKENRFIQNLIYGDPAFEIDDITRVVEMYRLGTVSFEKIVGALTIPFIDVDNNIRSVQVKLFDEDNHTTYTSALHSILKQKLLLESSMLPQWLIDYTSQDKKITCLFGEHLLNKYPNNPIALVEAPKTAIYGTLYFGLPHNVRDFIWLATGAKGYLTPDRIKILRGREVYVFPDLSIGGKTYNDWKVVCDTITAKEIGYKFIFSDLLERFATEDQRKKGCDLADVLVKYDWRQFRKKEVLFSNTPDIEVNQKDVSDVVKSEFSNTLDYLQEYAFCFDFSASINHKQSKIVEDWTQRIEAIELFLSNITLPCEPLRIDACTLILDLPKFIESHFSVVKANNGVRKFLPYLDRLEKLVNFLKSD